ncbi:MAG: hypothetical protein JW934_19390 [Anaerolineae bacterium]|nr:hypothetical protein [Anaerolineae bacterium]
MKSTPDSPVLTPAQQVLADWLGELDGAFEQRALARLSEIEIVTPSGAPLTPDRTHVPVLDVFSQARQRVLAGDDPVEVARSLTAALAGLLAACFEMQRARERAESRAAGLACARVDARRDLDSLQSRVQAHVIAAGQLTAALGEMMQDLTLARARQDEPPQDC